MVIAQILINKIEDHCKCDFTHHYIRDGNLQCFPQSQDGAVTYRTKITETPMASITDLMSHLLNFLSSTETIAVWDSLLKIDDSCPVRISSLEDPECDSSGLELPTQSYSSTDEYCIACSAYCFGRET